MIELVCQVLFLIILIFYLHGPDSTIDILFFTISIIIDNFLIIKSVTILYERSPGSLKYFALHIYELIQIIIHLPNIILFQFEIQEEKSPFSMMQTGKLFFQFRGTSRKINIVVK